MRTKLTAYLDGAPVGTRNTVRPYAAALVYVWPDRGPVVQAWASSRLSAERELARRSSPSWAGYYKGGRWDITTDIR